MLFSGWMGMEGIHEWIGIWVALFSFCNNPFIHPLCTFSIWEYNWGMLWAAVLVRIGIIQHIHVLPGVLTLVDVFFYD